MIFGQLLFNLDDVLEQLDGLANLPICFVSTSEGMLRSKPGGMIFGQLFLNLDDVLEQLDGLANLPIYFVSTSEGML